MLLSGSQRVKKEIHICWHLAQKYLTEVLSLNHEHSAGNDNCGSEWEK